MNSSVTKRIYRACLFAVLLLLAGILAGCSHTLHAPLQAGQIGIRQGV